jgi:hypothetical protein
VIVCASGWLLLILPTPDGWNPKSRLSAPAPGVEHAEYDNTYMHSTGHDLFCAVAALLSAAWKLVYI